jgi:hypothetical protein
VTRDELMGALWPASVPRDPAATLSTLLSGLRRALGPVLLQGRAELRLELPADAPWLEEHRRAQEDHRLEALELLAEASLALGGEGPARAQLDGLATPAS